MKKSIKNILIGILIGIVISIILGLIFLDIAHKYPFYEHHLNLTNPLILGNNNFMLCELEYNYYNFKAIWNSVNNELDLTKFCKDIKYDEELYNKYGNENIKIKYMQNIDEFFSGQEEEIDTSKGIYYISKLRENKEQRGYSYYEEVIIKVEDRTRGKQYFWEI